MLTRWTHGLLRRPGAEQLAAGVESLDLDLRARLRLPALARQAEAQLALRLGARGAHRPAVRLVAERQRDPAGGVVALHRRRVRLARAEAGEGQVQHGGAHLAADAA